ncbi:MAG: exodeoxyribonuclease VII small subunit [Lachnospiraceae bacterium]|nr:exodeoxyribonuclease VII small subunit [Lachnospiraceae bacterium]
MDENTKTLEQHMEDVETVVNRLEGEELSLEEALSLYEQGIKSLRMAEQAIGTAEKKMQILKEQTLSEDEDGEADPVEGD